jgi:hypothetical protein
MRFPYKLWVPSNRHNAYKAFIESTVDEPDDEVAVETEVSYSTFLCIIDSFYIQNLTYISTFIHD